MPRMHKSKIEIKDRECKASFDRNKKRNELWYERWKGIETTGKITI